MNIEQRFVYGWGSLVISFNATNMYQLTGENANCQIEVMCEGSTGSYNSRCHRRPKFYSKKLLRYMDESRVRSLLKYWQEIPINFRIGGIFVSKVRIYCIHCAHCRMPAFVFQITAVVTTTLKGESLWRVQVILDNASGWIVPMSCFVLFVWRHLRWW